METNIPADLLDLKARFDEWYKMRKCIRSRIPSAGLVLGSSSPLAIVGRSPSHSPISTTSIINYHILPTVKILNSPMHTFYFKSRRRTGGIPPIDYQLPILGFRICWTLYTCRNHKNTKIREVENSEPNRCHT
jgi:hypothetical protein